MLVTRPVLGRFMLLPLKAADRGRTEPVVGSWTVGANSDDRKDGGGKSKYQTFHGLPRMPCTSVGGKSS